MTTRSPGGGIWIPRIAPVTSSGPPSPLQPDAVSSLVGWWRADQNVGLSGASVTSWGSIIAGGSTMTQLTAGQEPQFVANYGNLNNLEAFYCQAATRQMDLLQSSAAPSSLAFMIVFDMERGSTTYNRVLNHIGAPNSYLLASDSNLNGPGAGWWTGATGYDGTTFISDGRIGPQVMVWSLDVDLGTGKVWRNGRLVFDGGAWPNTAAFSSFNIPQCNTGELWMSDVAMGFTPLTDNEALGLCQYAIDRYALPQEEATT